MRPNQELHMRFLLIQVLIQVVAGLLVLAIWGLLTLALRK